VAPAAIALYGLAHHWPAHHTLTASPALLKAHAKAGITANAACQPSGGKPFHASGAERVAFLLRLCQRITGVLLATAKKQRKAQ
jgi:hypothetical protein